MDVRISCSCVRVQVFRRFRCCCKGPQVNVQSIDFLLCGVYSPRTAFCWSCPLSLLPSLPSPPHSTSRRNLRLDRESDMAALLEATRPALKDVLGKVYSMSRDQVRDRRRDLSRFSSHVMPSHVMSCHIMSKQDMPCHAVCSLSVQYCCDVLCFCAMLRIPSLRRIDQVFLPFPSLPGPLPFPLLLPLLARCLPAINLC